MAKIAIGETAVSGLTLTRREPMAVLIWGLAIFVLGVLPAIGMGASFLGPIRDMIAMQRAGVEPTFQDMMALQMRVMTVQPMLVLLSIVLRSVLAAAVFRAVLEPRDRGFGYLRLGKVELWLILVAMVATILSFLAIFGAAIIIGVTVGVSSMAGSKAVPSLIGVVGGFAVFGAAIWVVLRLSMAFPMTFADRKFRLFESWSLTKGHSLSLLLTFLLVLVIIWLMEMVIFAIVAAVGVTVAGASHFDGAALSDFFARPPEQWLPAVVPWALGLGLIISLFGGLVMAVTIAPLAQAYRQLVPERPPEDDLAAATL
jgi:hypothetical protein